MMVARPECRKPKQPDSGQSNGKLAGAGGQPREALENSAPSLQFRVP